MGEFVLALSSELVCSEIERDNEANREKGVRQQPLRSPKGVTLREDDLVRSHAVDVGTKKDER